MTLTGAASGPRNRNRQSTTPFSSGVSQPACSITHQARGMSARKSQRSETGADFLGGTDPDPRRRAGSMKADYGPDLPAPGVGGLSGGAGGGGAFGSMPFPLLFNPGEDCPPCGWKVKLPREDRMA